MALIKVQQIFFQSLLMFSYQFLFSESDYDFIAREGSLFSLKIIVLKNLYLRKNCFIVKMALEI